MRFCDLFISYKIGLTDIKRTIPFTKLPLYRKLAVIATFAITIVSFLLVMFKLYIAGLITLGLDIVSIVVFIIFDSKKNNLELMLKEHYSPYSKKRMDMVINILHKYDININNINKIDLLIDEAREAQIQSDYLLPLKKPFKILAAVIVPIVAYVAEKIGDSTSPNEIITMASSTIIIVLLFFALFFALTTIVKDIFYRDYNKYNELISDLRQIKLFYAKQNSSSSN